MNYRVKTSGLFEHELKRLTKKYRSLKDEYIELVEQLEKNPTLGTPLGNNVYKIRISITSKGKGKSGGARVISYVVIDDKTVLLLTIYSKGERDGISDKEIKAIIRKYAG